MQVALAQYENDVRALRARKGMRAKVQMGRWVHQAHLGYLQGRKDGLGPSLIHDPLRAPLVRRGFEMVGNGGRSVPQVLQDLTLAGLRTKKGRKLDHREFRKIRELAQYREHVTRLSSTRVSP